MSEKFTAESYESRIDVAAVRVLEIIADIEKPTANLNAISQALATAAQADINQGLVGDVLEAMSGIFRTMADSASILHNYAGFSENTAYLFASPYVETDVKKVFKLLLKQGIGTRYKKEV